MTMTRTSEAHEWMTTGPGPVGRPTRAATADSFSSAETSVCGHKSRSDIGRLRPGLSGKDSTPHPSGLRDE